MRFRGHAPSWSCPVEHGDAAQNKLMEPPNKTWSDIIRQANLTPDILKQTEVLKNVQNILATNVSVCSSLGPPFASQMSHIYIDMLTVYRRAAAPGQRHAAWAERRSSNAAFSHVVLSGWPPSTIA